jgi:hydrogenase expression/formation protein HypE
MSADAAITLAHGSGGKAMRELIERTVLRHFGNPLLDPLEDQARIDLAGLAGHGDRLAFTTDSFVVDPIEFPGGDIGKLAVFGTVNDLAMSGARPLYLSCGLIIEEGLPLATLDRMLGSMKEAAREAGVTIVTGDTKVVHRGAADKLFINTAGIGVVPTDVNVAADRARPGDRVIVNGFLGDHGAAILQARGELALQADIGSDCQPLHELVRCMLDACPDLKCLRDATRGGLATVLNEFADSSRAAIRISEERLPVRDTVRAVCEILGLDPLYLANEGKLVAVVPAEAAERVLAAMRAHPAGRDSVIVGEVLEGPAVRVTIRTAFGTERILDMLVGEQLPRIC